MADKYNARLALAPGGRSMSEAAPSSGYGPLDGANAAFGSDWRQGASTADAFKALVRSNPRAAVSAVRNASGQWPVNAQGQPMPNRDAQPSALAYGADQSGLVPRGFAGEPGPSVLARGAATARDARRQPTGPVASAQPAQQALGPQVRPAGVASNPQAPITMGPSGSTIAKKVGGGALSGLLTSGVGGGFLGALTGGIDAYRTVEPYDTGTQWQDIGGGNGFLSGLASLGGQFGQDVAMIGRPSADVSQQRNLYGAGGSFNSMSEGAQRIAQAAASQGNASLRY